MPKCPRCGEPRLIVTPSNRQACANLDCLWSDPPGPTEWQVLRRMLPWGVLLALVGLAVQVWIRW